MVQFHGTVNNRQRRKTKTLLFPVVALIDLVSQNLFDLLVNSLCHGHQILGILAVDISRLSCSYVCHNTTKRVPFGGIAPLPQIVDFIAHSSRKEWCASNSSSMQSILLSDDDVRYICNTCNIMFRSIVTSSRQLEARIDLLTDSTRGYSFLPSSKTVECRARTVAIVFMCTSVSSTSLRGDLVLN